MQSVWSQSQTDSTILHFSKERKMFRGDFPVGIVNCRPGDTMRFFRLATVVMVPCWGSWSNFLVHDGSLHFIIIFKQLLLRSSLTYSWYDCFSALLSFLWLPLFLAVQSCETLVFSKYLKSSSCSCSQVYFASNTTSDL